MSPSSSNTQYATRNAMLGWVLTCVATGHSGVNINFVRRSGPNNTNRRIMYMREKRMQVVGCLTSLLLLPSISSWAQDSVKGAPGMPGVLEDKGLMPANAPVRADKAMGFKATSFQDAKWEKMLPELGADSPEISFLRVDPTTQATQLLIRTPTAIHIPKHWHSANETHTIINGTATFQCGDERVTQGPGSFNYMPSRMAHEAWTTPGQVVFITADGPWDIHWVDGPPTRADLRVAPPVTPTGPSSTGH
jgi:mannose-6-phosphate isomerase-like protein (cupin superfamily)